jgi:hypothetical protein
MKQEVSKQKLYWRDEVTRKFVEVDGWTGVFNPEVGRVVSVVTDAYALIPNSEVHRLIDPVLQDAGFNMKREIDISGKRHYWEYEFGSPFEPIQGDEYKLWILVRNSYDRTLALRFTGGFYRLVCSNGLVVGEDGLTARIVHAGKPKLDTHIKRDLATFVAAHQAGMDVVRRIAASSGSLSLLKGWDLLKEHVSKLPKKYYPRPPDGVEPEQHKLSAYDFLNEVTAAITHDKKLMRDRTIERRNYLLSQLSRVLEPLALSA